MKRRLQSVPRGLLVAENCRKLRWELERYRVDDKEDGKFKVVKSNDHAADALRYVCMSRLWYAPEVAPPPPKYHTFQPNYQPPYKDERFLNPNDPPLGAFN